MAIATPEASPTAALFGGVGLVDVAGIWPPSAWTTGEIDRAQCCLVDPEGRRTPLTPTVYKDRNERPGGRGDRAIWRVPDQGLVEYFEFAHASRPPVSGVVAVDGERVSVVAPWSDLCSEHRQLRELVHHYRLYRLFTGCGLALPGEGSAIYTWLMHEPGYRREGTPDYAAETFEVLRAATDQGLGEHAAQVITQEWTSQFGEIPSGASEALSRYNGLLLQVRRQGLDEPAEMAKLTMERHRRPAAPRKGRNGMEFSR